MASRAVKTFRVDPQLLRRVAKLDGLRPGEWVRLTVERAARERLAAAERQEARDRLRQRILSGDFRDEGRAEADRYDRLRHGGK